VVFQRYSVFPHLTVLGNVLIAYELAGSRLLGHLTGRARRTAVEQAHRLLKGVGLEPHAHKYPSALSGGMQQRLAIAQALAKKPRVLLLDEPFGALDPGIRAHMHELILPLWREHGMTVLMVTHDLKEGFALGTRLIVLDRWREDPQAQERFGAVITYDLDLTRDSAVPVRFFKRPHGTGAATKPNQGADA
jgi:NitT/TauT family transport system ATP-binding protein